MLVGKCPQPSAFFTNGYPFVYRPAEIEIKMEIEIGYNLSIKTTSLFLYFLRSDKVEVVREIIYLIFNQGG